MRPQYVVIFLLTLTSWATVGVLSDQLVRVGLGEICETTEDCTSTVEHSICDSELKVCECLDTHVEHSLPSGALCLQKATKFGDHCRADVQCTSLDEEALCLEGVCQCSPDTHSSCSTETHCWPNAGLGDLCIAGDVTVGCCDQVEMAFCPMNTSSTESRCKCYETFFTPEGESNGCYAEARLFGSPCDKHDSQCQFYPNSICHSESKTCVCEDPVPIPSLLGCLAKVENLHEPCQTNAQCQVPDSSCDPLKNTCECHPGRFVESERVAGTCVQVKQELGEPCEEDIQCTGVLGSAVCTENVCACADKDIEANQRCYQLKTLGDACDINEQCLDSQQTGELTVCDFTQAGHKQCVCRDGQLDGRCYRWTRLGANCATHEECRSNIQGASKCADRDGQTVCACEDGVFPDSSQGRKCLAADKGIGDACEVDGQCSSPKSHCSVRKICERNFVDE